MKSERRIDDEIARSQELERRRVERVLSNAESCQALWIAVIEKAVSDLQQLRRLEEKKRRNRYESELLDRIRAYPPDRFFEDDRFDEVCDLLGVDAEAVAEAFGLAGLGVSRGRSRTGREDPVASQMIVG